MTTAVRVLGASAMAVVGVGIAVLIAAALTHPRDEPAFLAGVREVSPGTVSTSPAPDVLVAEGDRACLWLGEQPRALWRNDQRFRFSVVLGRYTQQMQGTPLPWESGPNRWNVARLAWQHLCPLTWEVIQPRVQGDSEDG